MKPGKSKLTRLREMALRLLQRYGIWAALLLVLAVYLLSLTPHIGPFDSARFLILAKSIATGQGYREIQYVDAPPHTIAPPGFPLLLAPVWLLFPDFPANAYAFKLVPLIFGVATWGVFYLFLHRHTDLGTPLVLALLLLSALTPLMVFFAAQELMSETSYMFTSFLVLLLLDRVIERRGRHKLAFGAAIVALAASYYIRTVGLSLALAVVLYLALKRDFKRAALVLCLFGLLVLPWMLRNQAVGVSAVGGDYVREMMLRDYARPDLGTIDSYWELVPRVLRNGYAHMTDSLMWIFVPQLGPDQPTSLPAFLYQEWVKVLIGLTIVALAVWGAVADGLRRREVPLPALYAVIYLGPVLLQPWVGARNLIPIAPLLFYYFILGLQALARSAQAVLRLSMPRAPALLAWAAILVMLIGFARSDRLKIRTGLACYVGNCVDPVEQSFAKACQWIRINTSDQARFFTALPERLYLYTNRQSVPSSVLSTRYNPQVNALEEIRDSINGEKADYLILQPERPSYDGGRYDRGENPLLLQIVRAYPDRFILRYETGGGPQTLVFELVVPDDQPR